MTLLILNTFTCDTICDDFFLITWYKASLNIKCDFSFVIVPGIVAVNYKKRI